MTETVQQYRHLDYEVLIHKRQYQDAVWWCVSQFGKRWEAIDYRAGTWAVFWAGRGSVEQYRFCFAREKDMLLFALRWS
jgi:hypothetical protein